MQDGGRDDLVKLVAQPWFARAAAYGYCLLMLIVVFPAPSKHEFIYFQI
jgi:hypothetical protein